MKIRLVKIARAHPEAEAREAATSAAVVVVLELMRRQGRYAANLEEIAANIQGIQSKSDAPVPVNWITEQREPSNAILVNTPLAQPSGSRDESKEKHAVLATENPEENKKLFAPYLRLQTWIRLFKDVKRDPGPSLSAG
jgi:hypothetical protein